MNLPYEIMIPDTLFEEELLKFSKDEKNKLLKKGLKVTGLPGEGVLRAQQIETRFQALSIHDCFAFTLAERNDGCILLTGDNNLRKVATNHDIEVHGVLWAIEAIHSAQTAQLTEIITALELFENDETVRLPLRELRSFIKRFKALL